MPRGQSACNGEPRCGSHCHDRTAAPPLPIALPLRHCLFNTPHSADRRHSKSPGIPEISSDGDTHHFEPYADSVEDLSVPLTGKDREMFLEFNKF